MAKKNHLYVENQTEFEFFLHATVQQEKSSGGAGPAIGLVRKAERKLSKLCRGRLGRGF